jgi:hypothetical protein
MDTSDKRADETWPQWAARKHDEKHGPLCDCPGNPGRLASRMPLPAAVRTLDTVPEGQRVEPHTPPDDAGRHKLAEVFALPADSPKQPHLGDPAWVLDDNGSSGWPGHVISVSSDAADVYYAGCTEAFSLPDGRRGTRFLFLGQVTCRGCDKPIAPARAGTGALLWEDESGITQCMKAAGPLPVPLAARVMHEPMPLIPD